MMTMVTMMAADDKNNKVDGDSATGDGATGYDHEDYGVGRRRQ